MIETVQTISIEAPLNEVWSFAEDFAGWAQLMPGLQEHAVIDDDNSRWILKIGAGALVRTVRVLVHVTLWRGPEAADFTFRLEGDPVTGGGTYRARSLAAGITEIALAVRVEGTGPMAPMWEALGKPLLPKFARGFAEQFKQQVEQTGRATCAQIERKQLVPLKPGSLFARLFARLRGFLRLRSTTALE